MAESGGNPRAHNPNASTGDNSYGLFQINMLGGLGPARLRQYGLSRNEELFDPTTNARVAFRMSGGGRDWSPWSAYKNGAYQKYLNKFPGGGRKMSGPSTAAQAGEQAFATSLGGMEYFKRQAAGFFMAQAQAAAAGQPVDFGGLAALAQMRRQAMTTVASPGPAAPARGGNAPAVGGLRKGAVRELFHDPLGAVDEGQEIAPIGGHGKHVHAAFRDPQSAVAAIRLAQSLGLRVSENPYVDKVDPVHTGGSFHYRTFNQRVNGRQVGQGMDVSGSAAAMAEVYKRLRQYT